MHMEWIESLLYKAEGVPVLHRIANDLRFIYDIWSKEPASSQPVRIQATILDDFYHAGVQLRSQLSDSFLNLRQNWTGHAAQEYLGPEGTPVQIPDDGSSALQGAGLNLWYHLDLLTALLDYDGAAHYKAAAKLENLQALHETLDEAFMHALEALEITLALELIPGVDALADVIGGSDVVIDTAEALEIAEEIVALKETIEGVDKVKGIIEDANTVMQLLKIVVSDAMIGNVALLPLAVPPAVFTPTNSQPNLTYPPGVQSAQQQSTYQTLLLEYGDPQLAACFGESGLSSDACEALIRQFGLELLEQLADNPRCGGAATFAALFRARNSEGILQVAQNLANGGTTGQGYTGALYELWWMANNANNIIQGQLSAGGPAGKPKKSQFAPFGNGILTHFKKRSGKQAGSATVVLPSEQGSGNGET